jgi:Protein of unknown function (DUF3987)
MSTSDSRAPIDPALLKAIHRHGYCILVPDVQDAATILAHDMPGLNIPDVGMLTHEVLGPITSLALVYACGLKGETFAEGVRLRLEDLDWRGTLKDCALPEDCPNLATLAERYREEPHRFSGFLLDLFAGQGARQIGVSKTEIAGGEEWPDPLPFDVPMTLPPFPTEALPKTTAAYVQEVAASRQVPVALPAMLCLGVVAAAAARRFRVEIGSTHSEPLNIFAAVAMEPGSRKSAAYADMVAPLEAHEQHLRASMAPQIARAKEVRAIEEGRLRFLRERAVKAKTARDRDLARQEALQLASRLTLVPPEPRLIAGDVTPEKLANLLYEQDGRIALMDAEAGNVFGIMAGRYSRDSKPNLDVYLKGHAGDTLHVDRIGRTAEYVSNPALTVVLAPQPEVVRALANQPGFRGRGLLGRFLYAMPESLVGKRKYHDRAPNLEARARYTAVIKAILHLPGAKGLDGKDAHHALKLTGRVLKLWAEYADAVELAQADDGVLASIRDWASKLAGAVARIAGGLHLVQHYQDPEPWTIPISEETILAAWAIGDYLKAQALAAYAMMGADPNVSLAQRLLRWIERHGLKEFSLRDCHQHHRNVTRPEDLLPGLDILEGRGFLRRLASMEPSGPGRRPSPVFQVCPKIRTYTQNSQNS